MDLIGRQFKYKGDSSIFTINKCEELGYHFITVTWDKDEIGGAGSRVYTLREVERLIKEKSWNLIEAPITNDRTYPTWNLDISQYSLSPESPAIKKEDELKVGDLVQIDGKGLAIILRLEKSYLAVKLLGHRFNPYCAGYEQIVKDSKIIKELKEYFKQK